MTYLFTNRIVSALFLALMGLSSHSAWSTLSTSEEQLSEVYTTHIPAVLREAAFFAGQDGSDLSLSPQVRANRRFDAMKCFNMANQLPRAKTPTEYIELLGGTDLAFSLVNSLFLHRYLQGAVSILQIASEAGYADASYMLGITSFTGFENKIGEVIVKDRDNAQKFFMHAAHYASPRQGLIYGETLRKVSASYPNGMIYRDYATLRVADYFLRVSQQKQAGIWSSGVIPHTS